MPNRIARNSRRWIPLLIMVGALLLIYLLWRVLLVFILSALFAFIISPVVQLFERRLPRIFALISVYLMLTIIIILVVGIAAPVVSRQFSELASAVPNYLDHSRGLANSAQTTYFDLPDRWRVLLDRALAEIQDAVLRFAPQTISLAIAFFAGIFTLVFVPLIAFFMLLDQRGYMQMILAITPRNHRSTVTDLTECMGRVLWNFLKGRFILMLFVGLVTGVSLYLIGMPYPVLFGILAGLLELVPNLGPIATTVLVTLVALMIDPFLALKAGAVTIGVQLLENSILSPVVMGKTVGLDPVTVLFSLFLGGSVAGVLGAIIAVPLAMMVKIVILYFYVSDSDLRNTHVVRRSTGRIRGPTSRRLRLSGGIGIHDE